MSADIAAALLKRHKAAVEAAFDRLLPSADRRASIVVEAMSYSFKAGGKRLRPAFVLATAEALGGELSNVLPAAVAIEMIHTYSLIHDDLPCMDDDDLRRGQPTCHKKFSEDIAVLAGDALSNAAFFVIAEHTRDKDLVAPLVRELAYAAGTEGMIGGQILDVLSEGEKPDLDVVRAIHRMKTAALIRGSILMGAAGSRASQAAVERLGRFGAAVGQAFQIVDDILDEESDSATLGKTAGKDKAQQKMTYPAVLGIEKSRAEADRLIADGLDALQGLDPKGELRALARFICARNS